MEKQALTKEQMYELIDMGIDTSKASAFYYPNYGDYYKHPITKKYVRDIKSYNPYPSFVNGDRVLKDLNPDLLPAFTLQDILSMLPRAWEIGAYNANRNTITVFLDDETGHCHQEVSNCLLEAAFNMLKWCSNKEYKSGLTRS